MTEIERKALVERLFAMADEYDSGHHESWPTIDALEIAAHRIEALSAEIERLREALNEIKRLLSYANQDAVNEAIAQGNKNMAWHKARAALGEMK